MQSPNRPYYDEADQLRGLAALLVFFYHSVHSGRLAMGINGWPITHFPPLSVLWEGHSGVALFMVLSGFILAKGTFDKDISYAGFLRNRALRIFPLMFLVLVFAVYGTAGLDLGHIVAPFLLLMNTKAAFVDPSGLAGTVWTAAVEFQFYLVAPFLFALVGRRGILKFALPSIVLFWAFRMIVLLPLHDKPQELYQISYFTIVGRVDQFIIGIGLAYLVDSGQLKMARRRIAGFIALGLAAIAITLLLWALNLGGGIYIWHFWHVLLPEAEALIWAAFLWGYLTARPLEIFAPTRLLGAAMKYVGLISFSLYILHYSIQREFWTVIYPQYFNSMLSDLYEVVGVCVLLLVPVLALSALSYYCIEKPFIDMRGRYLSVRPNVMLPLRETVE